MNKLNAPGFPCPLTLICTVTGNTVTYSDPAYVQARIEKAGSLEKLKATFVSKAGRSQLAGKPAIQEHAPVAGQNIITDTSHRLSPTLVERLFTFKDGPPCRVIYSTNISNAIPN